MRLICTFSAGKGSERVFLHLDLQIINFTALFPPEANLQPSEVESHSQTMALPSKSLSEKYRFPDHYLGCVIPPQADSSRRRTKPYDLLEDLPLALPN